MGKKINRYLKNAYKVATGQKAFAVIAQLPKEVMKKTGLPTIVVVRDTFFEHLVKNHPELNKSNLFDFIKTLHFPDEIYQLPEKNKLNFFKRLEDRIVNLVATGKDWKLPQQNVITTFNAVDPKELKYAEKIKNTSKKVFPMDSGGAGNSSSNMLAQVLGAGARLPKSSESIGIIPKNNENI